MMLLLVRHGETPWNFEGRIQGHNRGSLNATGIKQAKSVGREVARQEPDVLYASPLVRAQETAQIISGMCHLPVISRFAFAEVDAGALDGLTYSELRGKFPRFDEQWGLDASTAVMPEGESVVQVQRRAWAGIKRLLRHHWGHRVVVVTHNFVVQAIICRALGISLEKFRQLQVDLGSLTTLEFQTKGVALTRLNDGCHLVFCEDVGVV